MVGGGRQRGEADFQEGLGGGRVGLVLGEVFVEERAGGGEFVGSGGAPEGLLPCPSEAGIRVASGFLHDARGEGAGGLDVGRVVEQHEGLLRDVRAGPLGGAFLAAGRVEGEHRGMQEAALPPSVKAAAELVLALARVVAAHGEVQVLPIAVGLVGARARPTNLRVH